MTQTPQTEQLSYKDATVKVLEESVEPMHYADIAVKIVERGYKTEVGANPAAVVYGIIWTSIKNKSEHSPFIRVNPGVFWLRNKLAGNDTPRGFQPAAEQRDETALEAGLIHALGMYWSRANVLWNTNPQILGKLQEGSTPVDFSGQKGVYLLHNGHAVVYVGRATKQLLGQRLRQHTIDRLNGRWDRFSWFGVYRVDDEGNLKEEKVASYDTTMLIVTMEALLIEGLEPPQNRKQGDGFRAVEFLQVEDPRIKKMGIEKSIIDILRGWPTVSP